MKTHRTILKWVLLAALLPAAARASEVGYQGRVVVNGTNFNGVGYFKFAIVNNGESISRWSNDGTSLAGSEPSNSVPLTVTKGLFSVELGNTFVSGMTTTLSPVVFASFDVYLKVWFSPNNTGFTALSPNVFLPAGSAYATYAEEAYAVRAGGVSGSMIGEGQVTSFVISNGTIGSIDLADGAVTLDKVNNDAVTSVKIVDGSINGVDLATNLSISTAGSITAASFIGNGASLTNLPVGSTLSAPDGSPNPAVTVNNLGWVGINTGTNAITNSLHVFGAGDNGEGLLLDSSSSSDGGDLTWKMAGASDAWTIDTKFLTSTVLRFTYRQPAFQTKAVLTPAGYLGLGTTTPSQTLHVAGNALVTGSIAANSFSGDGSGLSNLSTNGLVQKGGDTMTGTLTAPRYLNSNNSAGGPGAAALGGTGNTAGGDHAAVAGGLNNAATGDGGYIGGGSGNAAGYLSSVGGGASNAATNDYATIAGGENNSARGYASTIPGGASNVVAGSYSFAAGYRARATNDGDFVWADDTETNFAAVAANQFAIRASGGVGIGTNNPSAQLHVNGNEQLDGKLTINGANNQFVMQLSGSNNIGSWFELDNTLPNGQAWRFVSTSTNNGEGPGHLLFIQENSGVRMILSSNGNVGVGTSAPTNKLHVAGNIQATANVMAGAFQAVAQSTLSPSNTATLSPTTGYVLLTPALSVTLNVTTAISPGTMPGQYLILQDNNSNSVTIPDNANTQLTGPIQLGTNDTLQLIWSGTAWIQVGNANN